MPWTGDASLSGSATRPVPMPSSSAGRPSASSASRSTVGPSTSGSEHLGRALVVRRGDVGVEVVVRHPAIVVVSPRGATGYPGRGGRRSQPHGADVALAAAVCAA